MVSFKKKIRSSRFWKRKPEELQILIKMSIVTEKPENYSANKNKGIPFLF